MLFLCYLYDIGYCVDVINLKIRVFDVEDWFGLFIYFYSNFNVMKIIIECGK